MDGFGMCDPITHRPAVYEFHGCLLHGCPKCFPLQRDNHPICRSDRSLQEIYEHTLKKQRDLWDKGYNVIVMWECECDQEVKTNEDLQDFLSTFELVDPLEPRDAFFGGRTNAVKLHHTADVANGEEVKYVDVTSLYPWANKTCEYPVGHPESIVNPEDQDVSHYFGMAKVEPCTILFCHTDTVVS